MTNPYQNQQGNQPPYGQGNNDGTQLYGIPGQAPYGQPSAPQAPYGQPSAGGPATYDPQAAAQFGAQSGYGQQPPAAPNPYGAPQPAYDPAVQQGYYGQAGGHQPPQAQQFANGMMVPGYSPQHPPRPFVNPIQAVVLAVKNTFNYYGRASRSEFWWVVLAWVLLQAIPAYFVGGASSASETSASISFAPTTPLGWVFGFLGLVWFVVMLSLSARRLHDLGMSAWMLLLHFVFLLGTVALIIIHIFPGKPEGVRFDNPDGTQPAV